METIGSIMGIEIKMPDYEGQMRELAQVQDPKQRVKIYQQFCEKNDEGVTAAVLSAAIAEEFPKDTSKKPPG